MKDAMKKIGKHSHFELINGKNLPELGDRVLQIDTTMQYENSNQYGVYICEIADDEEVADE